MFQTYKCNSTMDGDSGKYIKQALINSSENKISR